MPMLAGRVAVVTGGARGLGLATVEAAVAEGAIPVVFDRDATALDALSATLTGRGVDHLALRVDVAEEAQVDAAFADVAVRFGRIDILVNNAGIAIRRPTLELSVADWQAVIDVNLTA